MLLSPRGASFPVGFSPHLPQHSHPHPHPHPHPQSQQHMQQPYSLPTPSHSSPSHHYQQQQHQFDADPYHHPPPSLFSPTHPSGDVAPSPSHQWSSSGKLKAAARSIFERAYGLNGRQREDHAALCDEVMRHTACSAKSFEELVYGHSYESELGELRKLVSDYRPKEAKKKERGGGRGAAVAGGKARGGSGDDMVVGGVGGVARQSSASGVSARSLLMPLYSQYPAATTPVSASRYEMAFSGNPANLPPRRKSLDANMLYGPQAAQHQGAPYAHSAHHTHSSSAFMAPSSFYSPSTTTTAAYHESDGSSGSYPSSTSLTPSHNGMRHRPNFASAAAAAAAAADSVVAYVASTPTSSVLNGGWSSGTHSPKTTTRESSASAFSFTPSPAVATTTSNSAAPVLPSASTAIPSAFLAQPSSSPPASSRTTLVHSPLQPAASLAASTTLAPVTLASIKMSPPLATSKLSAAAAALTSLPPPSLSSSASSTSSVAIVSTAQARTNSHTLSDPPSRASSRSSTPQPASPALSLAPPRPTIHIPSSPPTANDPDDTAGLNITGGSDIVRGSKRRDDEAEDSGVSGRGLEEKAERRKKKKERREERRGSIQSKQPQEEVEKQEAEKSVAEQKERVARGVLSWRRQQDADNETKELSEDSGKQHVAQAVKQSAAPAAFPLALAPATAHLHATVSETAVPSADISPPPTIDFPPYVQHVAAVATPLLTLIKRAGGTCALFTLVRLYLSYVSPAATSVDHTTALMLFLTAVTAAFVLLSTALSATTHKSAPDTTSASTTLSSELSRYLQAWDLIALDDPQQLLAAYSMTQQMLLSLLHSSQPSSVTQSPSPNLSPASLVSHAQSILNFLDVAHQHLYSDSGYTLLLDRLLTSAAAVRQRIQSVSSTLSHQPHSATNVLSTALLLQLVSGCALLAYVVLPCPVLRLGVSSAVVHVVLPAALLALVILGLLVVLEGERRVWGGVGCLGGLDEVDGMLELMQRMDKRMGVLLALTHTSDHA